ncbi:MAG: PilZ domain-containing protein [Planctomycetota bacterium]|nr:MAG: PilZ domain-containing protein [Planctomycetota bacterium]
MGERGDMIVRRYARQDLVLPAIVSVAPEHQSLVRFAPSACERDGWIKATLTDISPGGLGLITEVFVPRMSILRVRVMELEGDRHVLDVKVRTQRVMMTDRRPGYLLGAAFVDLTDEQKTLVESITSLGAGETNDSA